MNIIARNLVSMALLLWGTTANAGLMVDQKYNGYDKNRTKMSIDELNDPDYSKFINKWDRSVRQAIADDNSGIAPEGEMGGLNSGHILWNGKNYYAWAVNYLSAEQERKIHEDVVNKTDHPPIPGGGVCALYVHDQNLNKLASLKIDLPENDHGTWCNGIDGMGGAGKTVDGVLVSLSYYLAGKKPAQRAEDIGKGWRYMTVLIRFEEDNGKLVLKQDDSCFGNPNQITDIPSARKALARCSAQAK